jgi:hypothetical protein
MIIHTHGGNATSEFVSMVATGGASSEPHPVAAGGAWQIDTWRDDLAQARAAGRPLIGIDIRSAPADRVLQNQTWTDIALRLARHRGLLDDRPWVAIRTGEQSVVLVAQTDRRPPHPDARSHPCLDRFPDPTGDQPGRTAPLARYGRHSRVAVAVASEPANAWVAAAPHRASASSRSVGDSPAARSAAATASQYRHLDRYGNPASMLTWSTSPRTSSHA